MPKEPEIHASANRLRRRPLRNLNQWRDGLRLSFEYFPKQLVSSMAISESDHTGTRTNVSTKHCDTDVLLFQDM